MSVHTPAPPEIGEAPVSSASTVTTRRTLTRRGVLWLGQTCNLRCYFCYFLNRIEDSQHPEHAFMELDKAKEICRILREFYGNTAIDIQGGEPTIYPQILDLIQYCHDIGLHPTLITNGLVLGKPGVLEKYKAAGIRDFLVSLHGIGEVHDEVVCRKGAYVKIIAAIERMRELDVPFRFNCTLSKPVIPFLPEIAQKAIDYGANAVNFLAFNPFEDQETGIRTHDNVARYSDIKPMLTEAMDRLEKAGIEVNVRYLPMCFAEERHLKNFYNF
ncbi:MAG: radical SAM protein, partial [Candidatus Hydrogenedentes bacterium]|nr:radical SAM protein [Candidatus Hydrogenedentota bacterium]